MQYEAVDIGHKGVSNSKTINNPYHQAICLLNIGYAYAHQQEIQLAIVYLNKAVELGIMIENSRVQAIAHTYLTHAKTQKRPLFSDKEILNHFETAERLYQTGKVNFNRIENCLYWAKFLESINNNQSAAEVLARIEHRLINHEYGEFQRLYYSIEQKLLAKQGKDQTLIKSQSSAIVRLTQDLGQAQLQLSHTIAGAVKVTRDKQTQLVDSKVYDNLGAINAIGQYVATANNLDECLPNIYQQVASIFPTTEFGIAIFDDKNQTLEYRYFWDENGSVKSIVVDINSDKSLGSYCIAHRQTVHLNIVTEESISPYLGGDVVQYNDMTGMANCDSNSVIITPITLAGRVLGILSIQHKKINQYQQHHCRLFKQLASFIAIALDNRQKRMELEFANQTLDTLSKTDPLTNLYNRYTLDSVTARLIQTAKQSNLSLSMVVFDIDYYKSYNDHFGHQQGDLALKRVAKALSDTFDSNDDYLFRYGGDEFLLVSLRYNIAELEVRLKCLYEAIQSLALENPHSPIDHCLTLSSGGAFIDLIHADISYEQVFNLADAELYKVKARSRNDFSIHFHSNR